jgi:hypothetical protein
MDKIIIDGLNMFDVINWVTKKNRRYIANGLRELEEILGKDTESFIRARKLYLDNFNDYTRSILVTLFGNIEGLS